MPQQAMKMVAGCGRPPALEHAPSLLNSFPISQENLRRSKRNYGPLTVSEMDVES